MFGNSLSWARFEAFYIRGGDIPQPARKEITLEDIISAARRNKRTPLVYGPNDLTED